MSSTTDKIKGVTNEVVGQAKESISNATGDTKLQGEGKAQEIKGDFQKGIGNAKDAVKDAVDKI